MQIEIQNLSKTFDDFSALNNVNLRIESGELIALLGPSGCGKTTLLRIVAGLEFPSSGLILFEGENATDKAIHERNVGFVFQHYALFRHMNVFENVAFGLKVRRKNRPNKKTIRDKVFELLKLVQLEGLSHRMPSELSGGQRQRVALARALAVEPSVLLLDEPFGALDAGVRRDLRKWLRKLHDEIKVTSLFVTHDQDEALEVADRVVILNKGKIEQVDSPESVYRSPASPFVYHFLGNVNIFHGRMENGSLRFQPGEDLSDMPGEKAYVYVRPHEFDIVQVHEDSVFPATVEHIHAAGPIVRISLITLNGSPVEIELTQDRYQYLNIQKGSEVFVKMKSKQVFYEDYVI